MRHYYHGRPAEVKLYQTSITDEEATVLYGLAIALRPKAIAEVGTGTGRSVRAFQKAVQYLKTVLDWDCQVWTCDLRKRVFGGMNTTYIQGDCEDMVEAMTIRPELVFIDGNHREEYVRHDYKVLSDYAAPGALFVFHDVRTEYKALSENASAVLRDKGGIILRTPMGLGLVQ